MILEHLYLENRVQQYPSNTFRKKQTASERNCLFFCVKKREEPCIRKASLWQESIEKKTEYGIL